MSANSQNVRSQSDFMESAGRRRSAERDEKAITAPHTVWIQPVVPGRLQHGAQAADMDVDGALLDEHMIAPDLVEQHGAIEHALLVVMKKCSRRNSVGRIRLATIASDPVRDGIDTQAVLLHSLRSSAARAARNTALMRATSAKSPVQLRSAKVRAGTTRVTFIFSQHKSLNLSFQFMTKICLF